MGFEVCTDHQTNNLWDFCALYEKDVGSIFSFLIFSLIGKCGPLNDEEEIVFLKLTYDCKNDETASF